MIALGLCASTIDTWVSRGRLYVIHAGVYAVGHRAVPPEGLMRAALLACGERSALSGRTQAVRLELLDFLPHVVDVSVLDRRKHVLDGVVVHRPRTLTEHDIIVVDGFRGTSASRTLVDLAPLVNLRALRHAVRQAEFRGLVERAELFEIARTVGRRRGARKLRLAIGGTRVNSNYEARFLGICERAGVPAPRVNESVNGVEVDFHWPELRLIVEIDPAPTHDLAVNLQTDPQRDIAHALCEWLPIRFTGARIDFDAEGVERDIRHLVDARRRSGLTSLS